MATAFPQNEQGPRLEAHQVILAPIVTEKSTHQTQHRHAYPFRVNPWASKLQIKAAIEELFHVRVDKVRTQSYRGKKRRYRFRFGHLSNWKKAIVTLHPESPAIEFF
ncbi:MAG TPA: 50S ribosomal protein L23 [Gemmataceae bacterium]|nr:50S ribosomal protein L23 [Gemmataceae bacterium]